MNYDGWEQRPANTLMLYALRVAIVAVVGLGLLRGLLYLLEILSK